MPIFTSLIHNLYRRQPTCSADQLRDDFLEYPPKPLRCPGVQAPFSIVSINDLGGALFPFILLMRLAANSNANISHAPCEIKEFNVIKQIARDFSEGRGNATKTLRRLTAPQIFVALCLTMLLSPVFLLVILYIVGRIFLQVMATAFRAYKNNRKKLGFFLPVLENDQEIVVNPTRISKRGINVSSIISHEHIHLLQHVFRTGRKTATPGKTRVKNPEMLLRGDFCDDHFILYTLEKDEMEARLHELVLSYYRKFRHIPLTFDGFISMMARCSDLNGSILECLKDHHGSNYYRDDGPLYTIREKVIAEDIYFAILAIKSSELRYKFVTEVLATMYGNLIGYYGDEGASHKFLNQLEAPNLYDRIYHQSNS